MSNNNTQYEDIPRILNSICWHLKRIADSLEEASKPIPKPQTIMDIVKHGANPEPSKLRQILAELKKVDVK